MKLTTLFQKIISQNLSDRYDYFVTGSDQVWNPVNTLGSSIFF